MKWPRDLHWARICKKGRPEKALKSMVHGGLRYAWRIPALLCLFPCGPELSWLPGKQWLEWMDEGILDSEGRSKRAHPTWEELQCYTIVATLLYWLLIDLDWGSMGLERSRVRALNGSISVGNHTLTIFELQCALLLTKLTVRFLFCLEKVAQILKRLIIMAERIHSKAFLSDILFLWSWWGQRNTEWERQKGSFEVGTSNAYCIGSKNSFPNV